MFMDKQAGLMSGDDIKKACEEKEILIVPYKPSNVTPVGYNFSYSKFIMSLRTGQFHNIYYKKLKTVKGKSEYQVFFNLKQNETVLILTHEAIHVPSNIGGTFHSKVSVVTNGLSHVSTTLDPGWSGQLLIPMNNPTKGKIPVQIGAIEIEETTTKVKASELEKKTVAFRSFITLVLFRTITASDEIKSDNVPNRYELLKNIYDNRKHKDKRMSAALDEMQETIKKFNSDWQKNPKDFTAKFEEAYTQLAEGSDTEYNKIKQIADKQTKKTRVWFALILLGLFCLLVAMVVLGVNCPDSRWLVPTLITIPASGTYIKSIKEKLLG
jgi:deoxycytidine triphosphate deaminase